MSDHYDLKEQNKKISKLLDKNTIYQNAPELLLDAILDLNKILSNVKLRDGETESYKRFKKISESMRYAWNFMNDIASVYLENNSLKVENETLKNIIGINNAELSKYKAIEAAMLEGTLEERIKVIQLKNQLPND
jgi:hypothetical protein